MATAPAESSKGDGVLFLNSVGEASFLLGAAPIRSASYEPGLLIVRYCCAEVSSKLGAKPS